MNADVFIDTNVLLYTVDEDPVAAAKQMGCRIVYSEDLNSGQDYDGVTVVNPFAGATP